MPDYDILPDLPGDLTPTAQALVDAGLAFKGAHVCESERHPLLMQLAADHAANMARRRRQSHDGFKQRAAKIRAEVGNVLASEIVAESWDRQRSDPLPAIGEEMFASWRHSRGHWSVAKKVHKYVGLEMCQGARNGIWYACILVAD